MIGCECFQRKHCFFCREICTQLSFSPRILSEWHHMDGPCPCPEAVLEMVCRTRTQSQNGEKLGRVRGRAVWLRDLQSWLEFQQSVGCCFCTYDSISRYQSWHGHRLWLCSHSGAIHTADRIWQYQEGFGSVQFLLGRNRFGSVRSVWKWGWTLVAVGIRFGCFGRFFSYLE